MIAVARRRFTAPVADRFERFSLAQQALSLALPGEGALMLAAAVQMRGVPARPAQRIAASAQG